MTSIFEIAEPSAPGRARVTYQWVASVRAACDTLSRVPDDLMDSITVTGRLDGRQNEANVLRQISVELAERNHLQVSIEAEAKDFTVRFSRTSPR